MKNETHSEERKSKLGRTLTRRGFLKTMGSGAAIAATSDVLSGLNTAKAEGAVP